MVARKKVTAEMPSDCCGRCIYFKAFKDGSYCWVFPPVRVVEEDGGGWARGAPVEPDEPICQFFKPVLNA